MDEKEKTEEETGKPGRKWLVWILVAAVAAMLVIGIAGSLSWQAPEEPPAVSDEVDEEARMPLVVGMRLEDAVALIRPATEHIAMKRVSGADILFETGFVVKEQIPGDGAPLTEDTQVVLTCVSLEEINP